MENTLQESLRALIQKEIKSVMNEGKMIPKKNQFYMYTTIENGKKDSLLVKYVGEKSGTVPTQPWLGTVKTLAFRIYDKKTFTPSKTQSQIFVKPSQVTTEKFKEVKAPVKESTNEDTTYTYVHDPKTNKFNVLKVKDGSKVTEFSTEDQAKKHVEKINKLDKGYAAIKGKVAEGPLDKNITNKIIAIFYKKYGKYPKIKEIIEAWLSDGDNWKKAYYLSGEAYEKEVLLPINDKVRQWGKSSIFKNRPAFNSNYEDDSIISEGPEEMGAYRRLVITSPAFEKMKTEFTKFMERPEVKSMYPVRFKMIDSPKPNTVVVDVEGDKATVVAIKLSDLAKKLDKSVAITVRKERKLK